MNVHKMHLTLELKERSGTEQGYSIFSSCLYLCEGHTHVSY